MTDVIYLKSPYGLLGQIVMKLFLKNYFKKLLIERNNIIKQFAETEQWKMILKK